ncbi:MAG: spore coat protein U-like protein [Janthinobacterium sp.]|jgi:spore coat protein U-like protein
MLLAIAWLAIPGVVLADPVTAIKAMLVTAEIKAGCVIALDPGQTTGLDFGLLDFGVQPSVLIGELGAAVTAGTAAVVFQCTPGLALSVTLGAGNHASASQRRLANAGNTGFVPYAMYSDAAHIYPLAAGVATPVPLAAGGALSFLPLFGVATLDGTHAAGAYSDVIAVTLSW